MLISMLALLGSRTGGGEGLKSRDRPELFRHIQGMTKARSLCWSGCRSGPSSNRNAGQMLQRDLTAGYGSFCGCRKTCWQHSYYPNDVRIPWDTFRLTRAIFNTSSASSAGAWFHA